MGYLMGQWLRHSWDVSTKWQRNSSFPTCKLQTAFFFLANHSVIVKCSVSGQNGVLPLWSGYCSTVSFRLTSHRPLSTGIIQNSSLVTYHVITLSGNGEADTPLGGSCCIRWKLVYIDNDENSDRRGEITHTLKSLISLRLAGVDILYTAVGLDY